MEVEKVIIKKIFFTPNEIYSALLLDDELIMNKIKDNFEGKCTNKCYICLYVCICSDIALAYVASFTVRQGLNYNELITQ